MVYRPEVTKKKEIREVYDMLAQTPPMGWNTWNTFGTEINEEVILTSADALARISASSND